MRIRGICPICGEAVDPLYRQVPVIVADGPKRRTFERIAVNWCERCQRPMTTENTAYMSMEEAQVWSGL